MLLYALLLSLFISVSEIQTLKFRLDFQNSDFRQKKVSEMQTVWKRNATELSEIQTMQLGFQTFTVVQSMSEIRTFGFQTAPKSKHPCVQTSSVRISVVRAWALSFGTKLLRRDKSVLNPNRLFGFQTQIYKFTNVSEIQTFCSV